MPRSDRATRHPEPATRDALGFPGGGDDDIWGSAPYEQFSALHAGAVSHLLRRLPSARGLRWLDVGTGTGEVALPAAAAGARVTGCDLSPGMIESARRRAAGTGLGITFDVADARAMPYPDASFDVITASFSVNLVPDHAALAAEFARLCAPGGTLGLVTVLPERGQAEVFAAMLRYLPEFPADGPDPYAWADRGYAGRLLGQEFELSFEEGDTPQPGRSGEAMWQAMADAYGPAHRLVTSLATGRAAVLAAEVAAVYERYRRPDGTISMPRPYLIITGRRR